jgi:hypothetical protein
MDELEGVALLATTAATAPKPYQQSQQYQYSRRYDWQLLQQYIVKLEGVTTAHACPSRTAAAPCVREQQHSHSHHTPADTYLNDRLHRLYSPTLCRHTLLLLLLLWPVAGLAEVCVQHIWLDASHWVH